MISVLVTLPTITKIPHVTGLNNRNLLSHCSGGQKSKMRMPSGLTSGDPSQFAYGHLLAVPSLTLSVLCHTEENRSLVPLPLLIGTLPIPGD